MHIRGREKTSEVHVYNGGAAARLEIFLCSLFPCRADHERDGPPLK